MAKDSGSPRGESGSPFIPTSAVEPAGSIEATDGRRRTFFRPATLLLGLAVGGLIAFGAVQPGPKEVQYTEPSETTITSTTAVLISPPVACFALPERPHVVGDALGFENCSSDAERFTWSFGDGTESSEFQPEHTFREAGEFVVVLSASGEGGIDRLQQTLNVSLRLERPELLTCRFADFRMESDVWTWSETWTWAADDAVAEYRVQVQDGLDVREEDIRSVETTFMTDPTNGAPNSGLSLKSITAIGKDGQTTVRTVSPCGSEGGTGWEPPPS